MNTTITHLAHLEEEATRSYYNISHDPKGRGRRTIADYEKYLIEFLSEVETVDPSLISEAKEKYISKFRAWLSAQSSCASSFITGPANFPKRQQEKRRATADKRFEEFSSFPEYFLAKAKKQAKKDEMEAAGLTPLDLELQDARKNLAERERAQACFKAANKIVKSKKLGDAEKIEQLKAVEGLQKMPEDKVIDLLKPDFAGHIGFAPYVLTNNNAQIKRLKGRVAELEAKVIARDSENDSPHQWPIDGGYVTIDHELDRIQIFHDEKPDHDTRQTLKKDLAMRWSPKNECWQRKYTANAVWTVNQHYKLSIPRP